MARANGQGDTTGVARVSLALLVLLDRLNAAERIAFSHFRDLLIALEAMRTGATLATETHEISRAGGRFFFQPRR